MCNKINVQYKNLLSNYSRTSPFIVTQIIPPTHKKVFLRQTLTSIGWLNYWIITKTLLIYINDNLLYRLMFAHDGVVCIINIARLGLVKHKKMYSNGLRMFHVSICFEIEAMII